MTQSFLPPPPANPFAQPLQAQTVYHAPPPAYAQPPQAQPAPAYAPPPQGFAPPPYAQPAAVPQGFAPPPYAQPPQGFPPAPYQQPAAVPQGFQPAQQFPTSSLNGVQVTDGQTLFPQIPGNYDLQLIGFAKKQGARSGFAYWPRFRVLSSTAPEVPVGSEFSVLCKIALSATKNSGDRKRKSVLAACYAQQPNAPIDWDALSAQTEGLNLEQQPLFCHLRQSRSNRPILDPNTNQPTGQIWCDETWLPAKGA